MDERKKQIIQGYNKVNTVKLYINNKVYELNKNV